MRIMTILGSPRRQGNTAKVLGWIEEQFQAGGHEVDSANILDYRVQGCGKRDRMMRAVTFVIAMSAFLVSPATGRAMSWFAASDGRADAKGTRELPWDLQSTLDGRHKVEPGDTIWILKGTYRHPDRRSGSPGYVVRLQGREGMPISIRAELNQRVTLDGGLTVEAPATWLSIRDLEILVSENFSMSRTLQEPGSSPKTYNRLWGGLNIHSGRGCQYLNLVVHDNAQGISFWSGATDSEVHGCIIYDNGWKAPDRGHGHAIYTQNKDGVKTIENCIMTGGYGFTLHAYGSKRAYVDNYLVRNNVCYNAGQFLIGGGRPSHNIRVIGNLLYNVGMQIGYNAPFNEDCEVSGNMIFQGGLDVIHYKKVVNRNNTVIARGGPRPAKPSLVMVLPYRLDPDRANVVIFNWGGQSKAAANLASVLRLGTRFRLLEPRNFYGKPVLVGEYMGKEIEVPVEGEFAAYVLTKERSAGDSLHR